MSETVATNLLTQPISASQFPDLASPWILAETDPITVPDIFIESVIARELPMLLDAVSNEKTAGKRNVRLHLPFPPEAASIRVAVRNAKGQFITWKKITRADQAELVFMDLPMNEKIMFTATTLNQTGQKQRHQTKILPAYTATDYIFSPNGYTGLHP